MDKIEEQNEQLKECPFGISRRFCPYQVTFTKDIQSAIQGDLYFHCKLEEMSDCPEFENLRRD